MIWAAARKDAEEEPGEMVKEEAMERSGLSEESETRVPPDGAGAESVMVQVAAFP